MSYDVFNDLREAIVTKIADAETIQEATFYEKEKFDGSPAVVVGVSQNEALYNSQKVDRFTFVFNLRIYVPVESNVEAGEVETRLGKAYWELLTMFNKRDALSPNADIVEPLPSVWGWEERADGILRFAEINIRCVVFLSNRTIAGS